MPDLTELQRLAEGATPGPWEADYAGEGSSGKFRMTECFVRRPGDNISIAADVCTPAGRPCIENAEYIAAMHPDTAKKLIAAAEALELMLDCSSQEWQQADGRRMAATDNQGRRFWFITEDVMHAARTALEELK